MPLEKQRQLAERRMRERRQQAIDELIREQLERRRATKDRRKPC